MHRFKVGKSILMATFTVALMPLLQSCGWMGSDHVSWKGSDHVNWVFTTVDANGGDRFDWQGGQREIELTTASAHANVVVTKLEPADLWGLRKGDMFLRVADKPVRTVRDVLRDLHALHGADVAVWVKRDLVETKVNLRGSAYGSVLPPSIAANTTMTGGSSGSSAVLAVEAH